MAIENTYPIKFDGKIRHVYLVAETYVHPRTLCVKMYTDAHYPFATITVNLMGKFQSFSRAYIDTNNCPWAPKFLVDNGIALPVQNATSRSGYCIYPLFEFDISKLVKLSSYFYAEKEGGVRFK